MKCGMWNSECGMADALLGGQPVLDSSSSAPGSRSRSRWIIGLTMALLLLLGSARHFHLVDQYVEEKPLGSMLQGHPDVALLFRVKGDLTALAMGLTSHLRYSGALPTTEQGLRALTAKPTLAPVPTQYQRVMKMVLRDPWGREYRYSTPAKHTNKEYDLWSVGPDGIDGSQDDIGNWKAGTR